MPKQFTQQKTKNHTRAAKRAPHASTPKALFQRGKTLGFKVFLVCSIFVVALIGSCAYNLFLLSPFSSQQKVPSPYDWSNLKTDESGRLSYVSENGQISHRYH